MLSDIIEPDLPGAWAIKKPLVDSCCRQLNGPLVDWKWICFSKCLSPTKGRHKSENQGNLGAEWAQRPFLWLPTQTPEPYPQYPHIAVSSFGLMTISGGVPCCLLPEAAVSVLGKFWPIKTATRTMPLVCARHYTKTCIPCFMVL